MLWSHVPCPSITDLGCELLVSVVAAAGPGYSSLPLVPHLHVSIPAVGYHCWQHLPVTISASNTCNGLPILAAPVVNWRFEQSLLPMLCRKTLVSDAARELEKSKMARFDEKSGNLYVTELGRVASHFYIKHSSIVIYNDLLKRHMSEAEVGLLLQGVQAFHYMYHVMSTCTSAVYHVETRLEPHHVSMIATQCCLVVWPMHAESRIAAFYPPAILVLRIKLQCHSARRQALT